MFDFFHILFDMPVNNPVSEMGNFFLFNFQMPFFNLIVSSLGYPLVVQPEKMPLPSGHRGMIPHLSLLCNIFH